MVLQKPVCKSATCGKPDGPADSPTWTYGSRSFDAHRHRGGRRYLCDPSWIAAPAFVDCSLTLTRVESRCGHPWPHCWN